MARGLTWLYRADGGSDAFFADKCVATLMQHGDEHTVTWRASGHVQRFGCSRYAREAIHRALDEVPWDANGKPEIDCMQTEAAGH